MANAFVRNVPSKCPSSPNGISIGSAVCAQLIHGPDCLLGLLPEPFFLSYSVFVFSFSLFFVSVPRAGLSWPSRQILSARKCMATVYHPWNLLTTLARESELASFDDVALMRYVVEMSTVVAAADEVMTADDVRLVVTCSGCSEWTCTAPSGACRVALKSAVANQIKSNQIYLP